jgi:hypothetical protein
MLSFQAPCHEKGLRKSRDKSDLRKLESLGGTDEEWLENLHAEEIHP